MDSWERERKEIRGVGIDNLMSHQSVAAALQKILDRLTHGLDSIGEPEGDRGGQQILLCGGRCC